MDALLIRIPDAAALLGVSRAKLYELSDPVRCRHRPARQPRLSERRTGASTSGALEDHPARPARARDVRRGRVWFDQAVTGRSHQEIGIATTPNQSFTLARSDTVDSVRVAHQRRCAASRHALSELMLGEVVERRPHTPTGRARSLPSTKPSLPEPGRDTDRSLPGGSEQSKRNCPPGLNRSTFRLGGTQEDRRRSTTARQIFRTSYRAWGERHTSCHASPVGLERAGRRWVAVGWTSPAQFEMVG